MKRCVNGKNFSQRQFLKQTDLIGSALAWPRIMQQMTSHGGSENAVMNKVATLWRCVKPGLFGRTGMVLVACFISASALRAKMPDLDDEFVGPFASWVNVQTECGAVGDGKTDDTAAIQKGLDIINPANAKRKVLYIPAGAYRITKTLNVPRTEHAQTIGMGIIGEDPATTSIVWDGSQDGRMFYYCPWYARMMRLTLDGRGKAKDAIFHGFPFATVLGYTDMVFKDVQFGIETGERDGIAECLVLRCKFIRCAKAGINIQNFNTLDWWVWYSVFEDCHIGVSSEYNGGGGHFHVYESLFQNSTEADITIMHTSYFGFRDNTSVNSKAFFVAKRANNWTDKENYGGETTIQGNHIYDPIDATPIRIANAGNILLMDNIIRSRADAQHGPVIHQATPTGDADMVSIGNSFTVANPFDVKGRLTTQDEKMVSRGDIKIELPALPGTSPNFHRQVFDIPPGANAEAIQQVINAAAKLSGKRPVVHFPPGEYAVGKTLEIPAGADMLLVGDSIMGEHGNNLNWTGVDQQPMFLVHGPSHAIFRELYVNCARKAVGVRVDNCDQSGGRVNLQEVWMDNSPDMAEMYVDGLDQTDVSSMGSGFGKITAIGGPLAKQGKRKSPEVVCYGMGAGCRDSFEIRNGGSLLQRDAWYEGGYRTCVGLSGGEGTFTWDGGMIAVGTYPGAGNGLPDRDSGSPAIGLDNFQGKAAFIGLQVSSVDPARSSFIKVKGDRADMKALFLGCIFNQDVFSNDAPNAKVAVFHSRQLKKDLGTIAVPGQGVCDAAFLREMLAQTRSGRLQLFHPLKPDVTDVRFDRVFFRNGQRSIELLAATAADLHPPTTTKKP